MPLNMGQSQLLCNTTIYKEYKGRILRAAQTAIDNETMTKLFAVHTSISRRVSGLDMNVIFMRNGTRTQ